MKPKRALRNFLSSHFLSTTSTVVTIACSLLAAGTVHAGLNWTGTTSQDWNDATNWGGAFPAGAATVNLGTGNFPLISVNPTHTGITTLVVGAAGTTGRLDHTGGIFNTGNGNNMSVGQGALGVGIYNLANTAGTGGTLTGFGAGTGSANVGATSTTTGRLIVGDGTSSIGTVNMNTTGTLKAEQDAFPLLLGNGGTSTGTFNLDGGTLQLNSTSSTIGILAATNGGDGNFKMSGGTVNMTGGLWAGDNSAASQGLIELLGGNFTGTCNSAIGSTAQGQNFIGRGLGQGTLTIGGTATVALTGPTQVGFSATATAGTVGTLNVQGGSYTNTGDVRIGAGQNANAVIAAATGNLNVSAGVMTVNGILEFAHGNDNTDVVTGTGTVSGTGTLNVQNDMVVGFAGNANTGTFNVQTGGTVNVGTNALRWMILGRYDTSKGVVNVSGGNLNLWNGSFIRAATGAAGTASVNVFNQTGGNVTFYSDGGVTVGGAGGFDLQQSGGAAASMTYNLDGGTVTTNGVFSSQTTGTRIFNLNGGTLKAGSNQANFINLGTGTGTARANVRDLGAIIDSNGKDITIGQALLQSNVAPDVGTGGLTKQGAGTLSLTNTSTYTGATSVTGGTLKLDTGGNINTSASITVNGSGAKLVQNNFDTITPAVTITQGGLDGTGTINTVTIANNAANSLTSGAGGNFALNVGSLTFQGAASVTATANGTSMERAITAGALTSNAAGQVTVNITNSGAWVAGDYPVISYTSFTGAIGHFTLAPVTGLSPRQSASLVNAGGAIAVRIVGDSLSWTGAQNSNWSTTAVGGSQNWLLPSTNAGTEFLTNDVVVFDDSASNFNVSIVANVNPSAVIFDNATTYTFTSPGAFGIATGKIMKGNTGLVILATNNTYTGTTTVNDGTLQIGNGTVDGNINSSTLISANGAGVVDLKIIGTQTYSTFFGGTGFIRKSGAGTLNLTGSSTFTGNTGGFELTGGTLNVNSASALGTTAGGTLKISGGVLNTTIGGGITTTAAQPQNWAGDFTVTGSNNLNFNGGVVTLSGGGSRTVNIAAGTLGTGRLTSGDTGLHLTGPGILSITTAAASNIIGTLTVDAGSKLRMNTGADAGTTNDFITTGIAGAGTIENGGGAERWLFVDAATDMSFGGLLQDGAAGPLGFNKRAAGTLTLTGTNTNTGRFNVTNGRLAVSSITDGGVAGPLGAAAGVPERLYLGTAASIGILQYTGGDATTNRGFTMGAPAGGSGAIETASHLTFTGIIDAASASGFVKYGTGTLTFASADVTQNLNNGNNGGANVFGTNVANGTLEVKNGTFAAAGEIVVGGALQSAGAYTAGNLVVTSGATINAANWVSIGRGNGDSGIVSTLTVDGGTLNANGAGFGMGFNGAVVGFAAAPALDIKGASTVTIAGNLFCGESAGSDALITVGGTSTLTLNSGVQANKCIGIAGKGTLTINSGLVNAGVTGLTAATAVGGEGNINLNGGILASGSTIGGLGTSTITFDGGTMRADAAAANFLSAFSVANVNNGGLTIDTQAFAVTVAQALAGGVGSGGLTKNGVGTLTLTGVSNYVGNTTVTAGTLSLADNAGLRFLPGANGVSNKVTGAGTATIDGDFTIELSGAAIAGGNSWVLVDTVAKAFGASFTVNGFTEASDVWTLVDGANTWTFTEATGTLTLSVAGPAGYASWINGFGLAAGDKDALDDPDFDGTTNLMEYVLGGNPAVTGGFTRPTAAKSGSNLLVTFNRADLAQAAGDAAIKLEYGNNLTGWTAVTVPATSGTVGAVTFTITDGSPTDTVVASIPAGVDTRFFGRVKAEK